MLVIQSVLAPEVRYSALRGYPRTPEENYIIILINNLLQFLYRVTHLLYPLPAQSQPFS